MELGITADHIVTPISFVRKIRKPDILPLHHIYLRIFKRSQFIYPLQSDLILHFHTLFDNLAGPFYQLIKIQSMIRRLNSVTYP